MTTIAFSPNPSSAPPFSTNMTLDGESYLFTAFWNFYAQRYYFTLTGQNGNVALHAPLVGSPLSGKPINMVFGIMSTSTLTYIPDTGTLVVDP